ncbi:MAG: cache domain-containing protein [bacterium]|nr:MAG: cache domain-containing protein [bacterium]
MLPILRTLSLKAKLIIVYVFILGAGGLITSFIGSLIVNETIMNQAKSKVHHDLKTARMVYDKNLSIIKQAIYIGASGNTIQQCLYSKDRTRLLSRLEQIRNDIDLDFLTVTDNNGRVIFRLTQQDHLGDDVSQIPVIKAALSGKVVAATEILTETMLFNEDNKLAKQAHIRLIDTPKAKSTEKKEESSGMVLIAASPIIGTDEQLMGVLYGGHLLNRNFKIVDHVWELVYKGEKYRNKDIGTVTIFLRDLRISTNVKTKEGKRALGTRVSEEVYDAVLTRGEVWSDRAFVVNDWYISEYEPILNYDGETIGILYVGLLEKAYLAIRNHVVLMFIGVATIGFILIILISYLITRSITRPLGEMVEITHFITAGDLNHEVRVNSHDEVGKLGLSINTMIRSLKRMRAELEEWGKTLEQKVKERTEELRVMQDRVIQTDRLASLGKIAAGIAHEVNNPLGGILALSSLVLENIDQQDPNRQNLEEILKQSIRCRDIVKGLLQFSRQTEAKMNLVQINDVLNNTLALLDKQAFFHNIEVIKKFNQDLPLIMVDNTQFQQVFMNIILNAVQAMNETGTLTLATDINEQNNMVIVNISDTGCGISANEIDKIFDPFFTTKEVGKGTGLGLSIAYGIVTRHNGRMSVESKVGEGTTFKIKIPITLEVTKKKET